MITIFNRRELHVTFELQEQNRIRSILETNQIDYNIKTTNRMSASPMAAGERGRVGTLGQDMGANYEYKIYVHKADFEKASFLIQK